MAGQTTKLSSEQRRALSTAKKAWWASRTPEQRRAMHSIFSKAAKERMAKIPPKKRSSIAKARFAKLTLEQRAAITRAGVAATVARWKRFSTEERSSIAKVRRAKFTKEERTAMAEAGWAKIPPKKRSSIAKARFAKKTPEQRAAMTRASVALRASWKAAAERLKAIENGAAITAVPTGRKLLVAQLKATMKGFRHKQFEDFAGASHDQWKKWKQDRGAYKDGSEWDLIFRDAIRRALAGDGWPPL